MPATTMLDIWCGVLWIMSLSFPPPHYSLPIILVQLIISSVRRRILNDVNTENLDCRLTSSRVTFFTKEIIVQNIHRTSRSQGHDSWHPLQLSVVGLLVYIIHWQYTQFRIFEIITLLYREKKTFMKLFSVIAISLFIPFLSQVSPYGFVTCTLQLIWIHKTPFCIAS